MKKQTFGNIIVSLRKEKGMTQLELAEKMGVTDKAVSKWERDLSFPDVSSIPKLAEIFEVSVDDLMQVKTKTKETPPDNKINEIIPLALNGVALAMGIAVVVLLFLNEIEINLAIRMLAIGLVCLAIMQLIKKE
ncbi:transcriptional regulator [Erysipelatoclostridium sp. An173]|uniref:helix-turn-helix domain-containing protein n=1 Tax=Erysipelatoclostridium sp. An173 TaxID=1965571 RepID=UPI000B39849E|nr:helix-turn-helix transcriptional regulator [Erysipelatoclostridium sp. An173]OUP72343.1 transcriptional regulator [Erysipelatoclostridium sp. An173]